MALTFVLKHMSLFILVPNFLIRNILSAFIHGGLHMASKQLLKEFLTRNPEATVIATYLSALTLLTLVFI